MPHDSNNLVPIVFDEEPLVVPVDGRKLGLGWLAIREMMGEGKREYDTFIAKHLAPMDPDNPKAPRPVDAEGVGGADFEFLKHCLFHASEPDAEGKQTVGAKFPEAKLKELPARYVKAMAARARQISRDDDIITDEDDEGTPSGNEE